MSEEKKIPIKYLGDGVYASFDGYQIGLSTGNHENPISVFLEPQVLSALIEYAKNIDKVFNVSHFFTKKGPRE